ncbi:AP-4 complex accessory subunit RUSC2-like isoform X2 [Salvelinus fontinalis]|uniref:AP-4 complex accessory subunit RUSC2-like isoform X2 n=1 Tax=Salvelinus fontinalis TaxID=8038 RepID=UPI00248543F3|nr:AP-4 complex accessory subunit RUSC2-like isoform X2 [Salvelinus fontinalis]
MDSPPKLSGETLIVHHIPLVHCQVTGGRQGYSGGGGGSLRRSNQPENLGLSPTTSLPERDVLQRESLVYSSLIQTSTGGGRGGGGGGGGRGGGGGESGGHGGERGGGRGGGESGGHGGERGERGGGRGVGEGGEGGRGGGGRRGGGESGGHGGERGGGRGGGEGGEGGRGEVGGGSTGSDNLSVTSSNSEDQVMVANTLPRVKPREQANNPLRLRHNPFLLNTEEDDDEEEDEDEDDSDNLNGYLEDSSFHLHGNTNSALDEEGDGVTPFHLHDLGFTTHKPFLLQSTLGKHSWGCSGERDSLRDVASDLSAHLEGLDLLVLDGPRRHGSSGSTLSMDCGEQEWAEDEEEEEDPMRGGGRSSSQADSSSSSSAHRLCSCYGLSQTFHEHFPEQFSQSLECQLGYGSVSSCNSSDGMLVNFSAIYNKINNSVPSTYSEPPPPATTTNLNSSTDHSYTSSVCTSSVLDVEAGSPGSARERVAFYLDLHTSPTEPPNSHQPSCSSNSTLPFELHPHTNTSSCTCSAEHQGALDLDANCNSYQPPHHSDSGSDLTSCLQSQARLVVATQNYYKLVTCDLSSQSPPSPVGSSASFTSCSDEHSKESPAPDTPTATQPTEYYLFRRPPGGEEKEAEEEDEEGELSQRDEDEEEDDDEEEERKKREQQQMGGACSDLIIEGQVYINISPPVVDRGPIGGMTPRPHSRSYDRNLDKSPPPRLGSLERMQSCPVRLSEGASPLGPPTPPRVTSFAEIARSKRKNGGSAGSPSLRMGGCSDPFSSTHSAHSHSSTDFSPILENLGQGPSHSHSVPFQRCYSQGSVDRHSPGGGARETHATAEGGLSSSSCSSAVVRYTKDQRPTTLPIQPFTFHHQFSKLSRPKPILPLLPGYVSGMQARGGGPSGGPEGSDGVDDDRWQDSLRRCQVGGTMGGMVSAVAPLGPGSVRPSPLGSYSPVRLQGVTSTSCSTCTPSPQTPLSLSCPLSAGLLPLHHTHPPPARLAAAPLPPTHPPPSLGVKRGAVPPMLPPVQGQVQGQCHRGTLPILPVVLQDSEISLRYEETSDPVEGSRGPGSRTQHGQSVKQLQQYYSDFLPDYFSLTERPPDEFCLSPDASSSSSSSTSSQSHISVNLQQKRGLVKAINTAVDLIVAHFGTSRDPDVKAKLGNSWVSPNVGHLILKYLCPALREVLGDGLKAYVLDLIIGQRRNQPWSLVEASTQLGPSTCVVHSLFSKVSQYSELTSHSMRLNSFIFGLLNLRSLEFWFNHLYTHEDIVAAHYHPWGFLPLSQGPCQPLLEELLLLLQPLSLLPFDLDLLFEPRLVQRSQEHLRSKEQLCSASAGQSLNQSACSTFQLMRGWSSESQRAESMREGAEVKKEGGGVGNRERLGLRREGTWPRMEGVGERGKREGMMQRMGSRREGAGAGEGIDSLGAGLVEAQPMITEVGTGFANLWRESGRGKGTGKRVKGVEGVSHEEDGEKEERRKERERDWAEEGRQQQERDRQAGWWYQLMQSSQVYIDQSAQGGSKFVKSEKRKKSAERRSQSQHPLPRKGVVEGAESSQEEEVLRERSRKSSSSSSGEWMGSRGRGRPSWMGSPPESVLTQDKEKEKDPGTTRATEATATQPAAQTEDPSQGQGMRWVRLFGSSMGGGGTPSRPDGAEQRPSKSKRSRLPSGWLTGLDMSVLDLLAQTVGAGTVKRVEPSAPPAPPTLNQPSPPPQPPQESHTKQLCEVRALCHHIATEPDQLSFHKGDVLSVLSRADADWLLCSLGAQRGLVPFIYVTLRGLEDSQAPQEPQGPH